MPPSLDRDGFGFDHVDAATVLVELNLTVDQGEQGVIVPSSDPTAGVPLGSALTDQDVAGPNLFATELLNATSLSVAVATVAAGSLSFLVCHRSVRKNPRCGDC